ncbi:class A beta-lactamase-related serine hydrolase [Sinomicrobium pectinilyticum]|uniref:Class A beta-lactamase-related serine hydrolase n=1 Tax=Sinomicrobium pectinilyticum TaxID=1084421 RepID=A0A3N0EJ30_SINP1|nr:serine hydrolase domain-containing protein [Sinomicrobium pectinilyticum]RNL87893.1 class A beta-lactamase-related serine hydrolase [Sinomicrobium pectinilyticum]
MIFKNMAIYLTLTIVCVLTSFVVCGQNENITTTEGKIIREDKLTSEIKKIMGVENIPAISIAVINNNQVVYHQALGVSNIKTRKPVDDQSIFEAASLSKPVFAYFVMKMAEKRKIDLDKPLFEYLPHPGIAPESQEDAKLITARMVLAHQTGFPNHSDGGLIKLAFKPGTDFMYSGEAYQYLAAVVGAQNGIGWKTDLNALFQREVTAPLNMTHSTFVWDDYLTTHKVYGHTKEGKPIARNPGTGYWKGNTFFAYSSLHSEAGEYAKFIVTMLKKERLQKKTFSEMLKEQTHFKDDNPLKKEIGQTGWGLGFAQKVTKDYTMHMHTGNNQDFQAYAMFIPEKKYGLVVFTNSDKMIPFLTDLSKVLGPQF